MAHRLVTGMALVLLLFGSGSLGMTADMPASIREKTYNNVPYLSGGVGEEEIDLLRQVDGAYNVKLIFAATAGNYLSNVHILIEDSQGTKVLEAVSEGPWFYTKLSPGTYNVRAQAEGQTRQQKAQISQQKRTQLQFYW
ncbi:MAG TPA: hypothetical protein VI542_10220 [Candidatus Tectomicrobia bacterium]